MKVPTYSEQVQKVTPQTEPVQAPSVTIPGVVPGAFGGDIAKATEQLGKVGEQLAGHLMKIQQERQDKQVMQLETAFRQEMQGSLMNNEDETISVNGKEITRKKGFLMRPLSQAQGVTEEFDNLYQSKTRQRYLDGLSKYQRDKLEPALDNQYLSLRNQIITHEANQLDADFKNATESNYKQKVLDASIIRDGKQLALAIEDAQKTIAPYNSRYDQATRKIENEKAAEDIAKTAILSSIEQTGDYAMADMMLSAVKDKISPATYSELSTEIGKRAVNMAIAADMSTDQESSVVMKELQKGKRGAFGYLGTTELNNAVKASQGKIYYNSQIEKRNLDEQQSERNDLILSKIADRSITLTDIDRELMVPEEQGGLKRKLLYQYQKGLRQGILADLNTMLKEKNSDKEPTKRANMVKGYLDLITSFIDDTTDKWTALEKLASAYSDGIINGGEAVFLNNVAKHLNDIKFNKSTGPINSAIKSLKKWFNQSNASDEETAIAIKKLLGNQTVDANTVKNIVAEHIQSKVPDSIIVGEKGQLMVDAYGNKAMVYPDRIEPVIDKIEDIQNETKKQK